MKIRTLICTAFAIQSFTSVAVAGSFEDCVSLTAVIDRKENEFASYAQTTMGDLSNIAALYVALGVPATSCSLEEGRIVLTSQSRATEQFTSASSPQKMPFLRAAEQYWRSWLCTIPGVTENSPYDTFRREITAYSGAALHVFELLPRKCPDGGLVLIPVSDSDGVVDSNRVKATDVGPQEATYKRRSNKRAGMDSTIAAQIRSHVASETNLYFSVFMGRIIFAGTTTSDASKQEILMYASYLPNVELVINEIRVSSLEAEDYSSIDRLIEQGFRDMAKKAGLEAGLIVPFAANQTLYLMGLVTEDEASKANNVAQALPGVLRLVPAFSIVTEAEIEAHMALIQ